MKCNYKLVEGYKGILDNGRGHEVVTDLPSEQLGTKGEGPKSFELLAMALNGCIGTIFIYVAKKMRLQVEELRIEMETTDADTIEAVSYKLFVKTPDTLEKVEKCLTLTEKTCPVGMLFHKAGVPFKHEIVLL